MGKIIVGDFSGKARGRKKDSLGSFAIKWPSGIQLSGVFAVAKAVFLKGCRAVAEVLFYVLLWLYTPIVGVLSFVTVITLLAWLVLLVAGLPGAWWVGLASFLCFMAAVGYDRAVHWFGQF